MYRILFVFFEPLAQLGFERPNVNNIRSANNAIQDVWPGAVTIRTMQVHGCAENDLNASGR